MQHSTANAGPLRDSDTAARDPSGNGGRDVRAGGLPATMRHGQLSHHLPLDPLNGSRAAADQRRHLQYAIPAPQVLPDGVL